LLSVERIREKVYPEQSVFLYLCFFRIAEIENGWKYLKGKNWDSAIVHSHKMLAQNLKASQKKKLQKIQPLLF
jgi:hypothetical protein